MRSRHRAGGRWRSGPGRRVRALALPVRQREAVVLRICMGLSPAQAAAAMRISAGAANSHLARAMPELRARPGPH